MRVAPLTPSSYEGVPLWEFNPLVLTQDMTDPYPSFHFEWKKVGSKRRLIGIPNKSMILLHERFKTKLNEAIIAIGEDNNNKYNFTLRKLPSSTGCVIESNHYKNAQKHFGKRFLYITDFSNAYPSVDLERLSLLLVLIFRFEIYRHDYSIMRFGRNTVAHEAIIEDPLYQQMLNFVEMAFGGLYGRGLAIGGPLSPLLLNLYCEVFLDERLRRLFEKNEDRRYPERSIIYSRYVDDLCFSSDTIISSQRRSNLRRHIEEAGFRVSHRKSRVLDLQNGAVHVTKVGIERYRDQVVLRFPQEKRRRIEGAMRSYLAKPFARDDPEVIRGMIAEFLHYYKLVEPTKSDKRTMRLCRQFDTASAPYRKRYKERENKNRHDKPSRR